MDSHYPNSSYNYGDGQPQSQQYPYGAPPSSYASVPNLRSQYDQQQQQQSQGQQNQQHQTLPPLHPQRTPGSSSQLYEHYNNSRTSQAPYPSAATSQLNSGYSSANQFGGSFANYSHDALIPQQHQGYIQHDSSAPAYMGSSGFNQTLPPLPSTQPYGQPYSGAYDQPSHVVGAQGRRGILPSDDGRPPAVAPDGTGAARTNIMPVKDQDGKFPCPHCQKTYLHAKHLKRHLLRHTGDRPYSCFLCNDTFSRSDILKRHFQKCSIRRGNPTGASHLQNSQSHLRKQAAKRTSNDLGGKPGSSHDGTKSQPDSETNSLYSQSTISRPASDNFSSLRSDGRTDSSISTMSTPVREKARSMNGPQSLASIKAEPVSSQPVTPALPTGSAAMSEAPYSARDGASNMYTQRDSTPTTYRDLNGMSSMGGAAAHNGQEYEWNGLHAQQGQSGIDFVHPYFNVGGTEQDVIGAENNYNPWQFPHQNAVSFHDLAQRLTSYLQLDARQDNDAHVVRSVMSPDNVEHFLTKYHNFHQHWPNIHMPSFHPLTSYPGLTLAMCTVGAAYSDRVDISDVRVLLRTVKPHIYNVSDAGRGAANPMMDVTALNDVPDILEQIAALGILMKMVLWHTEAEHRAILNTDHGNICALVKRMGMLEPIPRTAPGFSELHQPDSQVSMVTAANFDYNAWLRQEKRLRTLYIIMQADLGQSLYFNVQPNFTVDEIKLPLPADDAPWEAGNAQDCAAALGLHGPVMQESINVTGSRRPKQIEFHLAMKVLAHNDYGFLPRATNAYGKFMLVHGIHIQIWFVHHKQPVALSGDSLRSISPLPLLDWIANNGVVATGSMPNSGQATPTSDSSPGPMQLLERELFKWRKHWDEDDALEYPPNTSQPRIGFCRDAKPFYWLGCMLLKNMPQLDPNAPWHKCFYIMMAALKRAKGLCQNEPGNAGLGLIMSADTIDPQYGMGELTLDMKLLFSPLSPAESPAVQPGNFAPMGP